MPFLSVICLACVEAHCGAFRTPGIAVGLQLFWVTLAVSRQSRFHFIRISLDPHYSIGSMRFGILLHFFRIFSPPCGRGFSSTLRLVPIFGSARVAAMTLVRM